MDKGKPSDLDLLVPPAPPVPDLNIPTPPKSLDQNSMIIKGIVLSIIVIIVLPIICIFAYNLIYYGSFQLFAPTYSSTPPSYASDTPASTTPDYTTTTPAPELTPLPSGTKTEVFSSSSLGLKMVIPNKQQIQTNESGDYVFTEIFIKDIKSSFVIEKRDYKNFKLCEKDDGSERQTLKMKTGYVYRSKNLNQDYIYYTSNDPCTKAYFPMADLSGKGEYVVYIRAYKVSEEEIKYFDNIVSSMEYF